MNLYNTRIEESIQLLTPQDLISRVPVTSMIEQVVFDSRKIIHNIVNKKDKRLLAIVGPCSIHDYDASLEYARKLVELKKKVEDKIFVVMRVYFEKPRTTGGWKGLVYDPDLNDTFDIEKGLIQARSILNEINGLGLSTATECLDPIIIEYLSDLVSWIAIGARTTESQIHRQLASGLSIPVGFKNGTTGDCEIAINAMKFASKRQGFFGINKQGRVCSLLTKGNPDTMLILRGGHKGANYSSEDVHSTVKLMQNMNVNLRIIIDCSHANSNKDFSLQAQVLESIITQVKTGQEAICGFMLESNLYEGNQALSHKDKLKYGVSITDECLSFEDTKNLLLTAYNTL